MHSAPTYATCTAIHSPSAASIRADIQHKYTENRNVLLPTRPEDVLDPGNGATWVSPARSGASGWSSQIRWNLGHCIPPKRITNVWWRSRWKQNKLWLLRCHLFLFLNFSGQVWHNFHRKSRTVETGSFPPEQKWNAVTLFTTCVQPQTYFSALCVWKSFTPAARVNWSQRARRSCWCSSRSIGNRCSPSSPRRSLRTSPGKPLCSWQTPGLWRV